MIGQKKDDISEDEVTKTTSDTLAQTQDWGWNWWTCVPNDEENSEGRDKQDEAIVEGLTKKYMHSTSTLGSCYAITANSSEDQAKACIDFLGLLYTDTKLADLYTYGIEGEDYTLNDEGKVVQDSEAYSHSAWESCSVIPLTLLENEPDNKVEMYEKMNNGAETSCAAGFRFDKSNVEAQFSACVNVFEQYGFVLENGGYASADVASVIDEYQNALDEAGYTEVETPILQSIAGGASARPFITHHNSLDIDLYLRIATELYLKRLIVGGFEGVYEIGKNFRNEGMDKNHNPEFTCMELYVQYKDYNWMMSFTEKLLERICIAVNGCTETEIDGKTISFKAPYRRLPILEAIKEKTGYDLEGKSEDEIRQVCKELNMEIDDTMGKGKLIDEIFGEFCEGTSYSPLSSPIIP